LRGLYAITDAALAPEISLDLQVVAAIRGGARAIQYRDKGKDRTRRVQEAGLLLSICRAHRVPLIVNDDLALAEAVSADGIHLGRDDVPLRLARERLGSAAIIGVSCYNQMERARRAESDGADYVAFGRFFASLTKPHAVSADIDLLYRSVARGACRDTSPPGCHRRDNSGKWQPAGARRRRYAGGDPWRIRTTGYSHRRKTIFQTV
jgi:thiamine-phosphate pyrophosphorylase